jgi:hypothetical protein
VVKIVNIEPLFYVKISKRTIKKISLIINELINSSPRWDTSYFSRYLNEIIVNKYSFIKIFIQRLQKDNKSFSK